jgi:hypothetical protein
VPGQGSERVRVQNHWTGEALQQLGNQLVCLLPPWDARTEDQRILALGHLQQRLQVHRPKRFLVVQADAH